MIIPKRKPPYDAAIRTKRESRHWGLSNAASSCSLGAPKSSQMGGFPGRLCEQSVT